jgi:hypothetical protein
MPDGTRRSGRIPKQVAIALIGSDIEGRVFSERTKTVVLSRHGAGIVSEYKLSSEQELVIRNEESHREVEARVVGQIGSDGQKYIYGVAFLDTKSNFWGVDFPELSETERQAAKTLLECSNCRARETADHSDLASDVMAINESIVRYCQRCGSSTLWKQAAPGDGSTGGSDDLPAAATSDSASLGAAERPSTFAGPGWMPTESHPPVATVERDGTRFADTDPPAPEGAAPFTHQSVVSTKERENRRKHARTRVNFKACVRRAGMDNDVVACEDMSRGGLRFKSKRQYFDKALIEVAVPYSPGDQAIFVPAQVVYVQELPEQKLYRCGVMYLRGRK